MNETLNNNDIYSIIKNEIINFSVTPGEFITESELTRRFDISRTPIREILKKLEYDGLVKIVPNKATQVTPIDFKAILDFIYIREKLEVGLVEDLISTNNNSRPMSTTTLNKEIIPQLTLIIAKQNKIIQSELELSEKALSFFELDNEFHKCLFSSLNKQDLWTYIMQSSPDYTRFRTMMTEFYTFEDLNQLLDEHKQILEFIKNSDTNALKDVYKNHINGGINSFQKIITDKENYFVL